MESRPRPRFPHPLAGDTDPDNWEFDKGAESWVSDNIKVYGGAKYRLQAALRGEPGLGVKAQWYKTHWQPASDPWF